MDTNELQEQSQGLANTENILRLDAGDMASRVRLLELTLADSVALTHRLTESFLTLSTKLEELESKISAEEG